jgi:hypothetical protein
LKTMQSETHILFLALVEYPEKSSELSQVTDKIYQSSAPQLSSKMTTTTEHT